MIDDHPKVRFRHPRVILCEGEGDRSFFKHLIEERGLPPFDIFCPGRPYTEDGAVEGYDDMLTLFTTGHGFRDVTGILVQGDNDEQPQNKFTDIRNKIGAAEGYAPPAQPLEVVRNNGRPALVVMMFPWVGELGALETLCLRSAEDTHPRIRACVEAHVRCVDVSEWDLVKQHKMRLRCMMASICKTDPNTSLVYAWSRRPIEMIPLSHSCFNQIADFLLNFDHYVTEH